MPVRMICQGSARMTWRTGTMPKSNPLTSASRKRDQVGAQVRIDGDVDGDVGMGCQALSKRRMTTPPARPIAPPASETSTASVSSWRRMSRAAGAERQAQRDFFGAVGGARGKQAAEIGAGGQQDQPGEQHQAGHEGTRRTAEHIADQAGLGQGEFHAFVVGGIGFGQRSADRVQVGGGLRRGNTGLADVPQPRGE